MFTRHTYPCFRYAAIVTLLLPLFIAGCSQALFSNHAANAAAAISAAPEAKKPALHPKSPQKNKKQSKSVTKRRNLPKGFVYLNEVIPGASYDIRYYSEHNFVGKRINGYRAPLAITTIQAAKALKQVNDELCKQGYHLKIFDAYRPKKAVAQFISWSKDPKDTKMQSEFYPHINKKDLFRAGYLATKSGHSRGSTVDLTIVSIKTGKEVDMGGGFDFLDKTSYQGAKQITKEQTAHRNILKQVMLKYGFEPYSKEWWHFTLINEPYPSTYFDFNIE